MVAIIHSKITPVVGYRGYTLEWINERSNKWDNYIKFYDFKCSVALYCAQLHFASLEYATSMYTLCILSALFFYAWLWWDRSGWSDESKVIRYTLIKQLAIFFTRFADSFKDLNMPQIILVFQNSVQVPVWVAGN